MNKNHELRTWSRAGKCGHNTFHEEPTADGPLKAVTGSRPIFYVSLLLSTEDWMMTTLEIKFEVLRMWGTITAGAEALECSRSQLSYCIHGKRKTPHIREKLARALNKSVEELFGK